MPPGQLNAPIRRIVLTHVHGDHIGSLAALHQALPDAEVLVGAREARLLARDFSLDAGEAQGKPRGDYPVCSVRPTRTLQPGEMVGSLRVVASPGHTPGHIAFLDTRDGTLHCWRRALHLHGHRRRGRVSAALPVLPDGDVGSADGAALRPRACRPAANTARGGPRPGARSAHSGDEAGD